MAYNEKSQSGIKDLVYKAYKKLDNALYIFDGTTEGREPELKDALYEASQFLERARNWIKE